MPFSEHLKLKVKHMAAFRCCRCQAIGVEIHHIAPQASGGSDTLDNAAPLCAKCHSDFGDNPIKQKEIREMRDWWYGQVSVQSRDVDPQFSVLEEKLDALLARQTERSSELEHIKDILQSYFSILIGQINSTNVHAIASAVVNVEKPPFVSGSPCQMSGQPCPGCDIGIMDIDESQCGVACNACGLFIPAAYPSK
ncbi:HNH endonuclease [Rhodanobacter sp. Si-c]|uniref:HNH endonuclease n=1 Tax=Rhodanobacter lycopersici TaxID=3162487 RepID=A0ABV3QBN7_9GAMM